MTQQEYQQKKHECWEEYLSEYKTTYTRTAFDYAFDRAYALGIEKEPITQEEIEKAAREYVLTRQQARHNAKKEEDATMRDFDKTIKAWDAYDMEQAFESGANIFIGRQEKYADTVISGWVARDDGERWHERELHLFTRNKPERRKLMGDWMGRPSMTLDSNLFPDLTWDSDPEPVEIIIKRKKK